MAAQNEIMVIVDYVENEIHNGKTRKKITTMAGEIYTIGLNLTEKWPLLVHGVALVLKMGTYQNSPYVDDIDTCLNITEQRRKEFSQPAPKNPKDLSIERQTAVKCVVDLMCSAYPDLPDDLRDATFEWLRGALK